MNDHNPINVLPAYIKTTVGIVAFFCLCSFVFFAMTFFCYFGWNENMQNNLYKLLISSFINPVNILRNYALCFDLLKDLSFVQKTGVAILFISSFCLCIFGSVNYARYMILGSYKKVFAKESEVEYARLFSGNFHFLGTAYKKPLRLPFNNSVLSFTEKDSLNPITIATPSIFDDNDCNMVIIDCNGNFQKLTAGYRGLLGKTLCFDWENQNDKKEGNFLPSWNPLAAKMLPSDDNKREKYISTLTAGILSTTKPANEMSALYLQCIISFFIAKIEKAMANDYFLNSLLHSKYMSDDDRASLMSYYMMMPSNIVDEAKDALTESHLNPQNYVPVGSWENIAETWQGKELNLPMLYDSMLQKFLSTRNLPSAEANGVWKTVLKQYNEEAELFNYPENIRNIISSLAEKPSVESDAILSDVMEHMSVFKNQAIREKMIFSDFSYDELRGFSVDDAIYPTTIYLSARTEDEKKISKMMLNVLINDTLEKYTNQNPIVFVIDDTQGLGYIHSLRNGICLGERANISFLVFNNDIDVFRGIYGEETYKDLILNTSYIMLAADNNNKHKRLLSATVNTNTGAYIDDMYKSVEKLATNGDDNAILIQNDETPLFIQTKLLTKQENAALFEDSIVQANPYIDEFTKAGRPAFFETFSVPKVYEENPAPRRGRKKKTPELKTDVEAQSDVDEWWLDEASFLPKNDNNSEVK